MRIAVVGAARSAAYYGTRLALVREERGSPDSLSIGEATPQEILHDARNASCACGTPIAKLSGPPAVDPAGGNAWGTLIEQAKTP